MGRWDSLADKDRLVIEPRRLPAQDILALERAFGERAKPRSDSEGGHLPAKGSIRAYKQAYYRFAGHLYRIGRLGPDQEPIERATEGNLESFYQELVEAGVAGHSIMFYFQGLRRTFQRMYPSRDLRYITHPGGISLRQRLDMSRRDINPPSLDDLIRLAQDCFQSGLREASLRRRFGLIQDAAIQAILCSAPPRRRALGEMRAGVHLRSRDGEWWLLLEPSNTKKQRVERHRLNPWTWPIIERSVSVERTDLVAGRSCTALWLKRDGGPLAERGIVKRIQWHTSKRFGDIFKNGFGPHMYRYAVAIVEAEKPSVGPLSPSIKLGHVTPNSTIPYLRDGTLDGVAKRQAATLEELRRRTAHLAERSSRERPPRP